MRVTASVEQFERIQSEISCVFKPAHEVKAQRFARRLDSERVSNILMTSTTFIWDESARTESGTRTRGPSSKNLLMEKGYVSRMPIYESNVALHAYELVSQPRDEGSPHPSAAELDALRDELGTFSEVGLDQIVGNNQAFVDVSHDGVMAGYCLSLSKQRVVLEVLDDIVSDPAFKDELRKLSDAGYRIAVRNTTPESLNGNSPSVADIVRVNVRDLGDDELAEQVEALSRLSVRLLADNVDTYEQFELCKKHNFEMYQGYFFCSPKITATDVPANRMAALRILAQLQDPNLSMNELEQTISTDVALTYKLLRFANSAFLGMNREVDSISHAAKLIGMGRIRVWASLLMFSKMDHKPRELMITAIVRAAVCERLATSANAGPKETFFTVGILSVLDALMDRPMEDALKELPISDELISALTRREGSLGEALQCVLAYERADWDGVCFKDVQPMTIRSHYLESLGWARRISEGLSI